MTLDREAVDRMARLAALELDPGDEVLARSLQSILDHVARLDELDLSTVPPTSFGARMGPRARDDEPRPGLTTEEALENAPDRADDRFRVPGILDG